MQQQVVAYELVDAATPKDAAAARDTALQDAHDGAVFHRRAAAMHVDSEDALDEADDDAVDVVDAADADADADGDLVRASSSTTSSAISSIPWTQVAVCALSAISGFLFGYDLCVMVVALPLIQQAFELSTARAEAVVSVLMVGAVFGSLAGGVLADRVGRKRAILVTATFFLLGSVCMTFADSLTVLLLGRFLAGLAVGSSGPCVSTYIAEIADPRHRGALVTVNEVMLCVGCLVSVVVSSELATSVDGWRKMLGVTLVPPLVQLAGMPLLPESPRWLLSKDRAQEARAVLRRLFPQSDVDETDARIKAQLAAKGLSTNLWDALRQIATDEVTRRRVIMSLLVALAHTFTGANAMLYYSSYIIDSLHPRGSGDSFAGVSKELGVAIAKLAGVCTAILVVDKVGRRPLVLTGSFVMLAAYLLFAACFWYDASTPTELDQETLGVWTLYVFIYAWNFSWAPLMWVICSEVLPDDLRSVGMGLTFAVYWLGSSLVNQTLLTIFDLCGMSASFLVYAALTMVSIAYVYCKVPETSGLSFEQITKFFELSGTLV